MMRIVSIILLLSGVLGAQTITIKPNGDGSPNQWFPSTGANKYAVVADAEGDCSVSVTLDSALTAGHSQRFTMEDITIPPRLGSIDSLLSIMYACRGGALGTSMRFQFHLNTDSTVGTTRSPGTNCLCNTEYSETLARPGGGSWAVADVNSLQTQITAVAVISRAKVWEVSVQVHWTPVVERFMSNRDMVGSVVQSSKLSRSNL